MQVIDKDPPTFLKCPRELDVNTSADTVRVWWEVPSAVDNVGVDRVVEPPRVSGGNYRVGEWGVQYQAVDHSGNMGWCNFTIRVHKICKLISCACGILFFSFFHTCA